MDDQITVVRRYHCANPAGVVRYYALVERNGVRIEVGSWQPLTDAEWVALAQRALPVEPEPAFEVEAEDGAIV